MPTKNNSSRPQSKSASKPARKPFAWYLVLMPLFVALFSLLYFEKGEIIALNSGCGWDGVTYKNVVWSLQWNKSSAELQERGRLRIDPYRAQRIAPSVAVYGEMQAAKFLYQQIVPMFDKLPAWLEWSYQQYPIPLWFFRWFAKDANSSQQSVALNIDSFVAGYFVFHNAFMLLGTALLWALIARNLALGAVARWLGFTALFVNVAVMKMSFYYPTLTDTSALFIGTLTLYAYLARHQWLVLIAAAIGFFTFPTAFYIAMLLFIIPKTASNQAASNQSASNQAVTDTTNGIPQRTARLIAATTTALMLLLSVYFVLIAGTRFPEVEPVITVLLPLTMPLFLAQWFFTVESVLLVLPLERLKNVVQSAALKGSVLRLGIALVFWGGLMFWKRMIQDETLSAPMNTDLFLGGSLACAVSKPLLTIVAAAVYFGPMVLFATVYFRPFLRTALRLGLGLFAVISVFVLLATMMTETRQLINVLPFVVVVIACMLNTITVKPWAVALLSAMSLVGSKIWLTMNFPEMQQQAANIANGSFTTFPLQWYFMNHGPWMSMSAYLVQAALVLVVSGVLWRVFADVAKE